MRASPRTSLSNLGNLPGLNTTSLSNLTLPQKQSILQAASKICNQLMTDLGVKWKPQPVDSVLRARTVTWIKTELEPVVGKVDNRFLLSNDAGLTYTERVYEGGDFETKCSMVKYVSVAIYLDDLIDKDAGMAKEAESFLVKMLSSDSRDATKLNSCESWLNQYRLASLELASHMSDPFVSNMLLHSCTLFIEGCALEYHIQQDQSKYFLVQSAEEELARDAAERALSESHGPGCDIPLPLDADRGVEGKGLMPHGWPIWLRERSAVAETFAITSFRAPYGIEIPTWLWVTAISELRTIILSINDVLSFAKELMADDATSSIAVLTKERRMIGMPGTAEDGGWCLRDTFEEVCGKLLVAGARINRLLRPGRAEARYDAADGRAYTVEELAEMIKSGGGQGVSREERMKALALKLWETHQRGYVAWHFQSLRYRTHELFDWVPEMMGGEAKDAGPGWITSQF
ncbi:hypothetical protein QBC44DRAFT_403701 [Cladorrhinum sp. PSN332]|nr:hypothetical protein QBC44DRAFT_403701 [Cladorrhinum sp. PSN332]